MRNEYIMWGTIFFLVIVCTILSLIYLSVKIGDCLSPINFFFQHKWIRRAFEWAIIAGIFIILAYALNLTNAIISVIHLVGFSLILDLITFIIRKLYYMRAGAAVVANVSANSKISSIAFYISIAFTILYLCYACHMAYNVKVTTYNIDNPLSDEKLKILMFADSHIGATFDAKGFEKYVTAMNDENADVIFIVGDFVDDSTSRQDMIDGCRAMSRLTAKYGVYYVYGNHEKGYNESDSRNFTGEEFEAELKKNNIKYLVDESVKITDSYTVIGRQDISEITKGGSRENIETLMSAAKNISNDSSYYIVLNHQPNDYDAEVAAGANLVLSGHTHGGQFIPITYVGEWIKANDKTYGHEKICNTDFIVTSGISNWRLKFKTGCISEYVIINVE